MKKVSELEGAELDYWVAKADGKKVRIIPVGLYPYDDKETEIFFRKTSDGYLYAGEIGLTAAYESPPEYSPSTDWSQGGPVIERERYSFATVGTGAPDENGNEPVVCIGRNTKAMEGPTHLIAAMRCYVASKFGEEVDDRQAHILKS